jgi:hypothetical protein
MESSKRFRLTEEGYSNIYPHRYKGIYRFNVFIAARSSPSW